MIRLHPRSARAAWVIAAGAAFAVSALSWADRAAAVPITFDTFGPLPAATFGGQGIPNDEVAVSSQIVDGSNTLTVALSATQRFSNPPLANDGMGTYFATPGSNFGGAGESTNEGALWNFNFYIDIDGPGVLADYQIDVFYDFDPAADTVLADLGSLNITNSILGGPTPAETLVETSQNLLFGFLGMSFPGLVSPPAGSFDQNALGEYTFAITVSGGGLPLETVAMKVEVVPEPTSLVLFGAASLLCVGRRR
ncbi:MAG: PEP-CTERM sorting domain-containing protein [Planctomycetota bacterium]